MEKEAKWSYGRW